MRLGFRSTRGEYIIFETWTVLECDASIQDSVILQKGTPTVLTIDFNEKANFIWSVADLLRGPYKPAQNQDSILNHDRYGTRFSCP